jgi:hypothetical protein
MKSTNRFLFAAAMSLSYCGLAAPPDPAPAWSLDQTNSVSDPNSAIWDAGTIQQFKEFHAEGKGMRFSFVGDFTQNGFGKLTGAGKVPVELVFTNDLTTNHFTADTKYNGSIHSDRGLTRIDVDAKATAKADLRGAMRRVNLSRKDQVTVNNATRSVTGRSDSKANVSGLGEVSVRNTINGVLPPEAGDGSWDLAIAVHVERKKAVGQATLTPDMGRPYEFGIKGNVNDKHKTSDLDLKGLGTSKDSHLKVKVANGIVTEISGEVAHQKVKWKKP